MCLRKTLVTTLDKKNKSMSKRSFSYLDAAQGFKRSQVDNGTDDEGERKLGVDNVADIAASVSAERRGRLRHKASHKRADKVCKSRSANERRQHRHGKRKRRAQLANKRKGRKESSSSSDSDSDFSSSETSETGSSESSSGSERGARQVRDKHKKKDKHGDGSESESSGLTGATEYVAHKRGDRNSHRRQSMSFNALFECSHVFRVGFLGFFLCLLCFVSTVHILRPEQGLADSFNAVGPGGRRRIVIPQYDDDSTGHDPCVDCIVMI
jgi:cobalamin biosynthesis Mg chelatase CobN